MLAPKIFLMVCDGLRPDSIDARHTPNLAALARRGVDFRRSHAVFPTVTRANSSSLATGVYPRLHGIAGNELVASPRGSDSHSVNGGKPFSTADADRLHELRPSRNGHVLLVPTLADRIHTAGGRTAVVSTGSTGAALLQNPQVEAPVTGMDAKRADLLLHPHRFVGLSQQTIESAHGPIPPHAAPNTAQNAYFTQLITDLLIPTAQHDLIIFWHTDPDHSQHSHGLGHPLAHQAIADADTNLGHILDAIEQQPEPWLVAITSDHGFSTITPVLGDTDITTTLIEAGLKDSPTSDDVVPVDGGIYLRDSVTDRGTAIIGALQHLPGIGPLFSGDGISDAPVLDGTMSRDLIHGGGDLAPDIQLSVHWSAAVNAHGTVGLCAGAKGRLAGTHGSLSPFEIRNTLIMAGPGIRAGVSEIPAAIVDIAPTLAHLSGLPWDGPTEGRILHEALTDGPNPSEIQVTTETLRLATPHGEQILERSTVLDHTYVDWGAVVRA